MIHGLHKFNKLRQEDDFSFSAGSDDAPANPATQLSQPHPRERWRSLGFHVIATIDSYNNVNRFLGRKALSEFEMRILFQMSANDSASLIDSPKAGSLGLNRALFNSQAEVRNLRDVPPLCPSTERLARIRRAKSLAVFQITNRRTGNSGHLAFYDK